MLGCLDRTAMVLDAVEMSTGSYGMEEPGGKARGLRERMTGAPTDIGAGVWIHRKKCEPLITIFADKRAGSLPML